MKTLILLLLPFCGYSQLIAKNKTIANLSSHGNGMAELQSNPNNHTVLIVFSNRRYESLVEYHSLIFYTLDEYAAFVSHIKSVDKSHDYNAKNYMITYTPKNKYAGPKIMVTAKDNGAFYWFPITFIKKYENALNAMK